MSAISLENILGSQQSPKIKGEQKLVGETPSGKQEEFQSLLGALTGNGESATNLTENQQEEMLAKLGESSDAQQLITQGDSTGGNPELENILGIQSKEGKVSPEGSQKIMSTMEKALGEDIHFDGTKFVDSNNKEVDIDGLDLKKLQRKFVETKAGEGTALKGGEMPEQVSGKIQMEKIPNAVKNALKNEAQEGENKTKILSMNKFQSGDDFVNGLKAMNGKKAKSLEAKNFRSSNVSSMAKNYSKEQSVITDNLFADKNFSKLEGPLGEREISSVESTPKGEGSNLMDYLLGGRVEGKAEVADAQIQGKTQVLDLGKLNTANPKEIISKIVNYIEQNQIQNADSLDVVVKHDELGQFKVNAQKDGQGQLVNLKVETMTPEAQKFFNRHEVDLIKNLNDSGIKLSNFKVVSSQENSLLNSDSKNSFTGDSWGGNSRGNQFAGQQRNSENNDSQRRRELWEQFKEQSQYASA